MQRLARLAEAEPSDAVIAKGSLQVVVDEATYALPLADVIDLDQERQRLQKELSKVETDIAKIEKKLGNPQFLERAPADVVEEQGAPSWSAIGKSWKQRSPASPHDI